MPCLQWLTFVTCFCHLGSHHPHWNQKSARTSIVGSPVVANSHHGTFNGWRTPSSQLLTFWGECPLGPPGRHNQMCLWGPHIANSLLCYFPLSLWGNIKVVLAIQLNFNGDKWLSTGLARILLPCSINYQVYSTVIMNFCIYILRTFHFGYIYKLCYMHLSIAIFLENQTLYNLIILSW
jgi:hypothetical protein